MFEQFPHSVMDTKCLNPIISQIIFHIYVETNIEDMSLWRLMYYIYLENNLRRHNTIIVK